MIRKATVKDVDAIVSLEQVIVYHSTYDKVKKEILSDLYRVFVYERDEEIVGYMTIYDLYDEIELHHIVVSDSNRGQGIASEMLSYLISRYPSYRIFLEVKETNEGAIQLYTKTGFNMIGKRKKYYENKIDALIYERVNEHG